MINLFDDPDRMLAAARQYLDTFAGDVEDNHDRLQDVERKIQNLQAAVTARAAEALKAGLGAETISGAVAQLEGELRELRLYRAQLVTWTNESEAATDRFQRLRDFAETAQDRLSGMRPERRAQIIELLDITVHLTDSGSRRTPPSLHISGAMTDKAIAMLGNNSDVEPPRL